MRMLSQSVAHDATTCLEILKEKDLLKNLPEDVQARLDSALRKARGELESSWSENDDREAKLIANTLLNWINGASRESAVQVAKHITTYGHRTLQQQLYPLVVALIAEWGKAGAAGYGNYDGRNEYTCLRCAEIVERCGDFVDFERPGAPLI